MHGGAGTSFYGYGGVSLAVQVISKEPVSGATASQIAAAGTLRTQDGYFSWYITEFDPRLHAPSADLTLLGPGTYDVSTWRWYPGTIPERMVLCQGQPDPPPTWMQPVLQLIWDRVEVAMGRDLPVAAPGTTTTLPINDVLNILARRERHGLPPQS